MAWIETKIGVPGSAEKIAAQVNVRSAAFRIREVVVEHDLATRHGIGLGAHIAIYGEHYRIVSVQDPGDRHEALEFGVERVDAPAVPSGKSRPRRSSKRRSSEARKDA